VTRIAVVPGVLALLPEYAGRLDPVAELRAACLAAVAWLGPAPEVIGDPQGVRVGRSLAEAVERSRALEAGAGAPSSTTGGVLLVANGTARRTQASPGPYDDRARPFDDVLAKALLGPDPAALRDLDQGLARELWASTSVLPRLAELLAGRERVTVDYDGAPHGVQYWVVRYER
jgi:hypothetical protein